MAYEFDWKLRAADTDFSGRVYTPAVLDYTVRAINQLMEDIGHSASQLHERDGTIYPVRAASVEYLEPIEVGDELTIHVTHTIGETSITFEAVGRKDGTDVFMSEVTAVFVDTDRNESILVPDEVPIRLAD